MTTMNCENLLVARRPGAKLFLTGGTRANASFEGMCERTMFFKHEEFDREMKRLGVPKEGVTAVPAKLHVTIG